MSGTIAAELDLAGGTPDRLLFTGGRIELTDEDMTVRNVAEGDVEILTRDVAAVLRSQSGAGAVTGDTLANAGHSLVYQEGTITTRYVLDLMFVGRVVVGEDVRDLSKDPDTTPLVGTTTITATPLEEGPLLSRYRIELHHTRDETRSQPVSQEITSLTGATALLIREAGSFRATGEMLAPSDSFVSWAVSTRGVVPDSLESLDPATGQPLAVLYALDAPPGPWTPPVTLDPVAGEIHLALPATGSRAAIRCDHSATLEAGSWSPVVSPVFPDGVLPVGGSGPLALPLPAGSR